MLQTEHTYGTYCISVINLGVEAPRGVMGKGSPKMSTKITDKNICQPIIVLFEIMIKNTSPNIKLIFHFYVLK